LCVDREAQSPESVVKIARNAASAVGAGDRIPQCVVERVLEQREHFLEVFAPLPSEKRAEIVEISVVAVSISPVLAEHAVELSVITTDLFGYRPDLPAELVILVTRISRTRPVGGLYPSAHVAKPVVAESRDDAG